jgi:hypothetical protein
VQHVADNARDSGADFAHEAKSSVGDCIVDRLRIGWRTSDNAQNLGGCPFALMRFIERRAKPGMSSPWRGRAICLATDSSLPLEQALVATASTGPQAQPW